VTGTDSEQVENDTRNVMAWNLSLEANRPFSISWRNFSGTIAPDACHHLPTVSFPMNDTPEPTFRGRNMACLQRLFPQQPLLQMAWKTRLNPEEEQITNPRSVSNDLIWFCGTNQIKSTKTRANQNQNQINQNNGESKSNQIKS
jgi:hypothetical protein